MSRALPHRSKTFSLFQDADGALCASGHTTKKVTKIKNEKGWIFKDFGKQSALLPQIEAGVAALYKLIKPKHIPKVRAVHKPDPITAEPRFYATVSQEFPDFMDLQTFLGTEFGAPGHEAKDKKLLDFLAENGLAEMCALSYFFEEDDCHLGNIGISDGRVVRIDFDMSAYSLVKGVRGERFATSAQFPITQHDLSHFPCVKDATPFYWPTTYQMLSGSRGYSGRAVELFSSLEHNETFRAKSYATFLKIICTPDAAMCAALTSHIADAAEAEKIASYFIARKSELRKKLLACPKFKKWWDTASHAEITSLFDDAEIVNAELKKSKHDHLRIDMKETHDAYRAFSYEMVREKIDNAYVLLANLVLHIPCPKIGEPDGEDKKFVYTMLTAFQKNIFKVYQECCDGEFLHPDKFIHFIRTSQNLLEGLEKISTLFPEKISMELNPFFVEMRAALHQLRRNETAISKEEWDSETTVFAAELEGQDTGYVMPDLIPDPVLDYEPLAQEMVAWVRDSKNRSAVADMFKNACMDYEKQTGTLLSNTYSGVCSAVGYACSWWKPAVAAVPALDIMTPELREMYTEINGAPTSDYVCHIISKLLCDNKLWSAAICEKFMLHLIAAFSREFSANRMVAKLEKDPRLAGHLRAQPDHQIGAAQAMEIAKLLKRELQPSSKDLLMEGDFIEVHHNSVVNLANMPGASL